MLNVEYTTQFKRDLKLMKRRHKNLAALFDLMKLIEHEKELPKKNGDHALSGNWNHHRELHIEPDWLLIYKLETQRSLVIFVRTGTHSDLFN
jgi:mRNA interferase YafQ